MWDLIGGNTGNYKNKKSKKKNYNFLIKENLFSISHDEIISSDLFNTGLGRIIRREGFKEIPPEVPRDKSGAFILDRDPDAFELLLSHLKGEDPLKECNINDFEKKYEALFKELQYWNIPSNKIHIPLRIWLDNAWSDGSCLYPFVNNIKKKEEKKIEFRHIVYLQQTQNLLENLRQFVPNVEEGTVLEGITPDNNLVNIYADKTKLIIYIDGVFVNACIQFGDFDIKNRNFKQKNFSSFLLLPRQFQSLLVLTPGIFVHLTYENENKKECVTYRKEESWICIHPLNGLVLSGVSNGVPYIFCFDMYDETSLIKFFPWGAIAFYRNIFLSPSLLSENSMKKETTMFNKEKTLKKELTILDKEKSKNLENVDSLQKTANFSIFQGNENYDEKSKCICKILRMTSDKNDNIFHIYFKYVSDNDEDLNMEHIKVFDVVDRKIPDGTFHSYVMTKGSLVMIKSTEYTTKATIIIKENSVDALDNVILIKTGCPNNQQLQNFFLCGEFSVDEGKYYSHSIGKKLLELHSTTKTDISETNACVIQ